MKTTVNMIWLLCDYSVCHNIFIFCYFALIIITAITATPTATLPPPFSPLLFSPLLFLTLTTIFFFLHHRLLSFFSSCHILHRILWLSNPSTIRLSPFLDSTRRSSSPCVCLLIMPIGRWTSFPLCHAPSGWLPHNILDYYCNIASLQPLIDISLPEAFFSRPFPSNADLTSHSTTTTPLLLLTLFLSFKYRLLSSHALLFFFRAFFLH